MAGKELRLVSGCALFIEKYIFPPLFLYFGFDLIRLFYRDYPEFMGSVVRLTAGEYGVGDLVTVSIGLRRTLLVLFNILVAWGLIVRKGLRGGPGSYPEIFYPLAGTFFYLAYNMLRYFPEGWNFYLIPERWSLAGVLAGYIVAIPGLAVATIATYNLRGSFAIFVEVRRAVTKGLYRYARHPIYSGHVLSSLGLCLCYQRFYHVVLTIIFIMITLKRASLEEARMSASLPEYRDYMNKTPPFLFWGIKLLRYNRADEKNQSDT